MALIKNIKKDLGIKDVIRIDYFDSRYYKILYEVTNGKKKTLEEEHFPSVTEILGAFPKPFLARWRGEVGNERAEQVISDALNLGSTIHSGAELIANGAAVVYNPYGKPIYNEKQLKDMEKKFGKIFICRFQKEFVQLYRIWQFFEIVKPTKIETEITVYSLKWKFAGTTDLFCYIKEGDYMIQGSQPMYLQEGFYLCDYKTGKNIDKSNKFQVSAYMEAIMEGKQEMRKKIVGGLLLHPNNEKIENGIQGFKATLITMEEQQEYFRSFIKVYDVYKIDKPIPTPKEFAIPTVLSYSQLTKGKK